MTLQLVSVFFKTLSHLFTAFLSLWKKSLCCPHNGKQLVTARSSYILQGTVLGHFCRICSNVLSYRLYTSVFLTQKSIVRKNNDATFTAGYKNLLTDKYTQIAAKVLLKRSVDFLCE